MSCYRSLHFDLSSKKLTALQELGLTSCGMTGGIPTEMGNLVNLSCVTHA